MHRSSKTTMQPAPMKTYCLLLLVLTLVCSFPGSYGSNGTMKAVNLIRPHFKVRKLGAAIFLDYYDPGPNPSHDPGKGKGGSKVGNNNP